MYILYDQKEGFDFLNILKQHWNWFFVIYDRNETQEQYKQSQKQGLKPSRNGENQPNN